MALKGVVGDTGNAGSNGTNGTDGDTGPQGIQGIQGDDGPQGTQGITGDQGDTGNQGIQGVQGIQGSQGPDGTVGDTAYEEAVAAGFVGTESAWLTSLIGDDGPQGPQGVQGTQGDAGVTGDTGPIGNDGSQGITGDTGIQGSTGPTGPEGPDGPQGTQGIQGIQGIDGPSGDDGIDGNDGAAGPAGDVTWLQKTNTYTAVSRESIIADTSGGVWTLTLPITPTIGDYVQLLDGADWNINNLTVARNGQTIEGDAEDMIMDLGGVAIDLIFDGTTWHITAQVGGQGGDAVTMTAAQTFTNKTIDLGSNSISGSLAEFNASMTDGVFATVGGTETLAGKTIKNVVIDGSVTEEIFAITGTSPALDPANGTIQTWVLSGASTPSLPVGNGESLTLMIIDGSANTITWPTVNWVNNAAEAPTLRVTGYSVIVIWKVAGTLYGALVGNGS
jgi:hypothetical protein